MSLDKSIKPAVGLARASQTEVEQLLGHFMETDLRFFFLEKKLLNLICGSMCFLFLLAELLN